MPGARAAHSVRQQDPLRVGDAVFLKGVDGQQLASLDPVVFDGALVVEPDRFCEIDELQEVRVWVGIAFGDSARDVEVAHREDREVADAPARFLEHLTTDGVGQ
jgi:hypothetical protein